MIQKFEDFLNEAKKMTEEEKDDLFNMMLSEIEKEFKTDPLKVTKAFGSTADDLFNGQFVCSKALDFADVKKIEKIYKKIKK